MNTYTMFQCVYPWFRRIQENDFKQYVAVWNGNVSVNREQTQYVLVAKDMEGYTITTEVWEAVQVESTPKGLLISPLVKSSLSGIDVTFVKKDGWI